MIVRVYCTCIPSHTTENIFLSYRCTDVGPFLEQHLAFTDQESNHTTQIVIEHLIINHQIQIFIARIALYLFDQV